MGFIHYDDDIIKADRAGGSPFDYCKSAVEEIRQIKEKLDAGLAGK